MNERNRNKIAVGMIAACALGLLLYGGGAKAADLEIIGPSYHTIKAPNVGKDFNNATYGIALRVPVQGDFSITGGVYKNSYWKNSVFLEGDYLPLRLGTLSLGVGAGLVTGYQQYDGGGVLKPMAGIVADWQVTPAVGVVVRVMPLDVVAWGGKPARLGAVANMAFMVRFGG